MYCNFITWLFWDLSSMLYLWHSWIAHMHLVCMCTRFFCMNDALSNEPCYSLQEMHIWEALRWGVWLLSSVQYWSRMCSSGKTQVGYSIWLPIYYCSLGDLCFLWTELNKHAVWISCCEELIICLFIYSASPSFISLSISCLLCTREHAVKHL